MKSQLDKKSSLGYNLEPSIIEVHKTTKGGWELLMNEEPYYIRGVVYTPGKIGESPDDATLYHWMNYDDNNDGINDPALQTWVDKNKNFFQDADEMAEGDYSLLQKMEYVHL